MALSFASMQDWIVDFPCMPADNAMPRSKKRRFFITVGVHAWAMRVKCE